MKTAMVRVTLESGDIVQAQITEFSLAQGFAEMNPEQVHGFHGDIFEPSVLKWSQPGLLMHGRKVLGIVLNPEMMDGLNHKAVTGTYIKEGKRANATLIRLMFVENAR